MGAQHQAMEGDGASTSPPGKRAKRQARREARIAPCDPICVECGELAERVKGDAIYPHRPDLFVKSFYLCKCGAYVGCHPFTRIALGRPAGPVTRQARNRAHNAFDILWKRKMRVESCPQHVARQAGYAWLAGRMNLEPEHCHIGWMTAADANRVVSICNAVLHAKATGGAS